MIVDNEINWEQYIGIHSGISAAFQFIQGLHTKDLPAGRYPLPFHNAFAIVQEYESEPVENKLWESHRCYADLQFIVQGEETIYWNQTKAMVPKTVYDAEKDILFYKESDGCPLLLRKGDFVLLFPQDGHKPSCCTKTRGYVKKVVVKLPL